MVKLNCSLRDWSDSHFKSLSITVTLTSYLYSPFTYLAACLCTFSNIILSFVKCGFQIVVAYSSLGRTNVPYALSLSCCDACKLGFNKPNVWLALQVINWMCLCHFLSLWIVRPNTCNFLLQIKHGFVFCMVRQSCFF